MRQMPPLRIAFAEVDPTISAPFVIVAIDTISSILGHANGLDDSKSMTIHNKRIIFTKLLKSAAAVVILHPVDVDTLIFEFTSRYCAVALQINRTLVVFVTIGTVGWTPKAVIRFKLPVVGIFPSIGPAKLN